MECGVLVASHLSSLFPSSLPISVPTSHKDILSLFVDSSASPEHASYSTLFHTSRTGTILLRLIHRATLLELIITLTRDAPQLRFDFPGAILPSPAVGRARTTRYYRLWQPSKYRFRQYDIQNMQSDMEGKGHDTCFDIRLKLRNLPADAQKLLSVFPEFEMENPVPYVLAFIPAASSLTSGGYFHLFSSHSSDLHPLNYFECSVTSAHCHLQDFVVIGSTLYTVWDKQGQFMVEDTKISFHDGNRIEVVWNTATYAHEAELTPAYLEKLLLSAGSMADKFFEAISRPGIFSPVTLRTAIDQYTDACRSLSPPYAPRLLTMYGSMGEQIAAVVGCTVELTRDPSTCAPQYDRYWNGLKRDWEGFVARCREIKRHARWPLAIGMGKLREGILVVERERIMALVDKDFPLRSRRLLAASSLPDPQFTLLEILCTLRAKIGTRPMIVFEDRLVDLVHQEIAFPYADIIQDQADQLWALADEEVVAKMRDMHVSSTASGFTLSYSLIHCLLTQYDSDAAGAPVSAHLLLDSSGLLESLSPANATKLEVLFWEWLRLLGYREASRESLAWLPRTAEVKYVLGRLWLDEGRYDDAASVLTMEDHEAPAGVLPGAAFLQSVFDLYLHIASLFKAISVTSSEVVFSQLALSVAPPGVDTASLWHAVIRGLTDLGLYEDVYAPLVSHLYKKLCEHAVDRLMVVNFTGFVDEVDESLSFKARNVDPRVRPFYSRILYTLYISRGDYRNAALTKYQRARKLASLFGDPANFIEIAELQLEAYVVGMNALTLTDQKNTWVILLVTAEFEHEVKYGPGKRDMKVVELADMQYEYTLLTIRLELIRRDPTLPSAGDALPSPLSVILHLTQANRFNMDMATARTLNVDMTDLFGHLTGLCLRLSRNPEAVIGGDTSSDWLLTDKVISWPGTAADRGWRYLRELLERHDGPDTDYRYTKVTLETILELDRTSPPRQWLTQPLKASLLRATIVSASLIPPPQVHHPEYLIRTCLRYEMFEGALEHTLSLMRK
ncbi:hypothetical protein SCP_0300880 [Sparassis crispa]|uniref:Nucleoporin n=1 Tax=Sparassis crispa TaxID=139825 RepID=A0A401GE32_9APHY|nr:hypothetical protein SCP_0300880 [Sparassis crispa]GBE80373.1 hypothetical protein SCP_0300880 [Sparassis crispa]